MTLTDEQRKLLVDSLLDAAMRVKIYRDQIAAQEQDTRKHLDRERELLQLVEQIEKADSVTLDGDGRDLATLRRCARIAREFGPFHPGHAEREAQAAHGREIANFIEDRFWVKPV